MRKLPAVTERQANFIEHYSIHKKPSDAYRYAYNATNMNFDSVAAEAYKVRMKPQVALRLYEIETAATDLIVISVAQKKQWLKTIVEMSLKKTTDPKTLIESFIGDPKAAIAAMSELNKMDGDLAAQKKEITGIIGINIDDDDDEL